jgi:hypothetical protein
MVSNDMPTSGTDPGGPPIPLAAYAMPLFPVNHQLASLADAACRGQPG